MPVDVTLLNEIDFDFVFLCVDNHRARKHVLEKCLESGTPLIDMGPEFRESRFGYIVLVDKNAFPEGACINCYTDLSKKYSYIDVAEFLGRRDRPVRFIVIVEENRYRGSLY